MIVPSARSWFFALVTLLILGLFPVSGCRRMMPVDLPHLAQLHNELLTIHFHVDDGIFLESLRERESGHDFIPGPADRMPLLNYHLRQLDGSYQLISPESHLEIQDSEIDSNGRRLSVGMLTTTGSLKIELHCQVDADQPELLFWGRVANQGDSFQSVILDWPILGPLDLPGNAEPLMGAVPVEIGTVRPLIDEARINTGSIGALGVGTLYRSSQDPSLSLSIESQSAQRREVVVSREALFTYGALDLQAGESRSLQPVRLRIDRGDWRRPVRDYVERHRGEWQTPDTPDWLRHSGAIYCESGSGGGAIYMTAGLPLAKDHYDHFHNMPQLLDEARQLGTDVIYLFDYWEGLDGSEHIPYWIKGDYIPRSDMGGPEAFREGIRRVHELGGRVILYVEPFIVYKQSRLGRTLAAAWTALEPDATPKPLYGNLYHIMDATREPWQAYLAELCADLIEEYDADGIYLDSYGWQWNHLFRRPDEDRLRSRSSWNAGVLETVRRVRRAIRNIKPDAVVLTEGGNELMMQYADGYLDATFAWMRELNQDRLLASPIRYAYPPANYYSNGRTLAQLNQVFAAGHNLALDPRWLPDAEHVRQLVKLRRDWADALIDGRQHQLVHDVHALTAAYLYEGKDRLVLTAVNASEERVDLTIPIPLRWGELDWHNALDEADRPQRDESDQAVLTAQIDAGGIRIFTAHLAD